MKKLIIIGALFLAASATAQTSVKKDTKGNYYFIAQTIKKDTSIAIFTDKKGDNYPVFKTKTGRIYYERLSKSGNIYRVYLKEV